jgi:hypothetical protein
LWGVECVDNQNNSIGSEQRTITISSPVINTGGGGGGGGGGSSGKTYVVSEKKFNEGYSNNLSERDRMKFKIGKDTHYLKLIQVESEKVRIDIYSETIHSEFSEKQVIKFDLTGDEYYDLYVRVEKIDDDEAEIVIQRINEPKVQKSQEKEEEKNPEENNTKTNQEGNKITGAAVSVDSELNSSWYVIVGLFLAGIAGYSYYFHFKNTKKKVNKKTRKK